jgi:hypothetical protein
MTPIKITLLCVLGAATALAQDVRYNFASGVDFSGYRTYRWVPTPGAEQLDEITDTQLRGAIEAELAAKGLIKSDSEVTDAILTYQTSVGTEKQVTTIDNGYYGPGWGWYGYGGGGMSTSTTSTIVTGQLVLDIYDAKDKKMIWRGTASKTLDMKAKPEKRQKNIRKAMAKLLKNYPPPVKK